MSVQHKALIWDFPGGLKLNGHKELSNQTSIQAGIIPKKLIIPLQQNIGEPANPIVNIGERVLKGQMIAQASGYVSVPAHASSSGIVVDIGDYPVAHPSGLSSPCIVIETDGKDECIDLPPVSQDYHDQDPSRLRNRIREAGIVGLGGAGFPSFIKLNPTGSPGIHTLILNGAECEPYITCDQVLMRERPDQVLKGAQICRHALQADRCIIGVEDNKLDAIGSLNTALEKLNDSSIEIVAIPTIYPGGGEKQIVKTLTNLEVPSNGLPSDIGVVCHNVATAANVFRVIVEGEPLITRIVTVTGNAMAKPGNLEVRLGTPIRDIVQQCGGTTEQFDRLIMGGPMMGFGIQSDQAPIVKTSNCLLAVNKNDINTSLPVLNCIRCSACADVCPVRLLPQQLYWYCRAKELDKAQDYNLFDCIECGCCAYVCPSHIPLVQYYRFAKTEIWAQERERHRSEIARRRHDFRLQRIERDKLERKQRMQKKRQLASPGSGKEDEAKKQAIQAALERVQKRKSESSN